MAQRRSYVVGRWCFATQKALLEHVRRILHSASYRAPLTGDEFEFVIALLSLHPSASTKIGCGVAAIWVETNPVWVNTLSFYLRRTDGTQTDFSFMECVRPSSKMADFQAACRRVVCEDILQFKQSYFLANADAQNRARCQLSGEWVAWHDCHVDHQPPWTFQHIVDGFIDRWRINPQTVELTGHADNELELGFGDSLLAEQFRVFHNQRAQLRIVSARVHLRLPGSRASA